MTVRGPWICSRWGSSPLSSCRAGSGLCPHALGSGCAPGVTRCLHSSQITSAGGCTSTRVTSEGSAPSERNVSFGEPLALLPGPSMGSRCCCLEPLVRASDAGTRLLPGTQTPPKRGSPNSVPAPYLSSSSLTMLLSGRGYCRHSGSLTMLLSGRGYCRQTFISLGHVLTWKVRSQRHRSRKPFGHSGDVVSARSFSGPGPCPSLPLRKDLPQLQGPWSANRPRLS